MQRALTHSRPARPMVAQSAVRAHWGRCSLLFTQKYRPLTLAQVLKFTSTRLHVVLLMSGHASRHAPLWQTDPVVQSESIVQKGRGRVSTRHTPSWQTLPAPQVVSLVQVARQAPPTQTCAMVQRPAQSLPVGYAHRPLAHTCPAPHTVAAFEVEHCTTH